VDRLRLEEALVRIEASERRRNSGVASARRVARAAGFLAVTPTLLAGYSVHDALQPLPFTESEALRDRWVTAWANAVLHIFGLRVITIGRVAQRTRGRCIVSNHRGVADVLVLLRTFGGRMVSRADLSQWPLIGIGARKLGTVFVDRARATSGATTIRTVRELLRAGATVTIFPEGTTFAGDGVRPFHAGGLAATLRTGAEIVPVGLAYSSQSQAAFLDEAFTHHLSRMAAAPPSFVVVSVGAPMHVAPSTRAPELATIMREAVAGEVVRARAEANRHEPL
jgi:1-acyl-sn-glycerol-3-phosphate acyltransferase